MCNLIRITHSVGRSSAFRIPSGVEAGACPIPNRTSLGATCRGQRRLRPGDLLAGVARVSWRKPVAPSTAPGEVSRGAFLLPDLLTEPPPPLLAARVKLEEAAVLLGG